MALRSRADVLSVPPCDPKSYYSVMFLRRHPTSMVISASRATGSGPGEYMVVGRDEGCGRRGSKRCFGEHPIFGGGYRTQFWQDEQRQRQENRLASRRGHLPLTEPIAAVPAPNREFRNSTRNGEDDVFEFSTSCCSSRQYKKNEKEIRPPSLHASAIGPGKTLNFKTLGWSKRWRWFGHEGR